jgi:hypothetical protein
LVLRRMRTPCAPRSTIDDTRKPAARERERRREGETSEKPAQPSIRMRAPVLYRHLACVRTPTLDSVVLGTPWSEVEVEGVLTLCCGVVGEGEVCVCVLGE